MSLFVCARLHPSDKPPQLIHIYWHSWLPTCRIFTLFSTLVCKNHWFVRFSCPCKSVCPLIASFSCHSALKSQLFWSLCSSLSAVTFLGLLFRICLFCQTIKLPLPEKALNIGPPHINSEDGVCHTCFILSSYPCTCHFSIYTGLYELHCIQHTWTGKSGIKSHHQYNIFEKYH